jgi:hypothetical protein
MTTFTLSWQADAGSENFLGVAWRGKKRAEK